MKAIPIFRDLLVSVLALAIASTAVAADDVYIFPVEEIVGFEKLPGGATAENRLGWGLTVDTLGPEDIVYKLVVSDKGEISVFVSTEGSDYLDLNDVYTFGIDTFQQGVLALSGGADIEAGMTRFNFAFDVGEMSMVLHISSVYSNEVSLSTSAFLYTGKCT